MEIQTAAKVALRSESLGPALREFADYVRARLEPAPGAAFSISLSESGYRLAQAAVPAMPPGKAAFGLGFAHSPGAEPITGARFLAALGKKPKRTFVQADFSCSSRSRRSFPPARRSSAPQRARGV